MSRKSTQTAWRVFSVLVGIGLLITGLAGLFVDGWSYFIGITLLSSLGLLGFGYASALSQGIGYSCLALAFGTLLFLILSSGSLRAAILAIPLFAPLTWFLFEAFESFRRARNKTVPPDREDDDGSLNAEDGDADIELDELSVWKILIVGAVMVVVMCVAAVRGCSGLFG